MNEAHTHTFPVAGKYFFVMCLSGVLVHAIAFVCSETAKWKISRRTWNMNQLCASITNNCIIFHLAEVIWNNNRQTWPHIYIVSVDDCRMHTIFIQNFRSIRRLFVSVEQKCRCTHSFNFVLLLMCMYAVCHSIIMGSDASEKHFHTHAWAKLTMPSHTNSHNFSNIRKVNT